MRTLGWLLPALLGVLTLSGVASAADVPVSTTAELMAAAENAQAGDVILLADGTYSITAGGQGVRCMTPGTASEPIVVRAANPLGARVECDAVECFYVDGAHWHFEQLDIHGVCGDDSKCEHAFHVVGNATDFVMRANRIVDFNAQLKVNADGEHNLPDRGLVEANEIFDTRARNTSNPVTKLNIDNASAWVVRDNFIHDFEKGGGNGISFGAFHKGGSHDPVFERNLVLCSLDWGGAGARIGLSLGGGGMSAGMCPPWDGSDCNPETFDGVIRNNIIVNCSDVAIYLNEAQNTKVLHNTMIATNGIDFRFSTSTGEAHGNVLSSVIRVRDQGSFEGDDNLMNLTIEQFEAWYADPMAGDLRVVGDVSSLVDQSGETEGVQDDYCGRTRTDGAFDWGALEHSLGDCATVPPPGGGGGGGAPDGGVPPTDSGSGDASEDGSSATGGSGGSSGSGGSGGSGGSAGSSGSGGSISTDGGPGGSTPQTAAEDDGGCGCRTAQRSRTQRSLFVVLPSLLLLILRRRKGFAT